MTIETMIEELLEKQKRLDELKEQLSTIPEMDELIQLIEHTQSLRQSIIMKSKDNHTTYIPVPYYPAPALAYYPPYRVTFGTSTVTFNTEYNGTFVE